MLDRRASLGLLLLPLLALAAGGCAFSDSVAGDDNGESDDALGVARGVDYAWSRPSPHGLKADGYGFVARYLSYDTTGKTLTKGEAEELTGAGLDIVCNWEESGTAALDGYSQGRSDAAAAAKQAKNVGMPGDRPIYFSVDFDAQASQQGTINAYFDGVASVIGRDRTGAYGGYYLVDRLFNDGKIKWAWQAYAWSSGHWDGRAQMRQTLNDQEVAGGSVDLDVAIKSDYGQWGHGAPKTTPAIAKTQPVGAGVTANHDSRLEAFYFASNGALAHSWQDKPNGSWSSFAKLGGNAVDKPAVLANKDGRLEAFVTEGGTVRHIWQTAAGGSWSHFDKLGDLADAASAPAVAENADGSLEVFVTTSGGKVEHIWQTTAGGDWSSWANLGGNNAVTAPALGVNHDGRLEVFVTTSSGALEHIAQKSPNGGWGNWASFGGRGRSAPAVGRNEDGRLEVFVTTDSNAVEHIWQTSAGGGWSDWSNLGGCNKSAPAVEINADGRLEVFVEGCAAAVWHAWQAKAGGAWSSWSKLGGTASGAPIAARDADGRLEVFISSGGKVDHIWQTELGGAWAGWASLGTP
jgi:hypothetical protein